MFFQFVLFLDKYVHKAANIVFSYIQYLEQNKNNKNELIKLGNPKLKAFLRNLPSSKSLLDFGVLLNNKFKNNYGITGALYRYNNNINKLIHEKNI